jgi:hypothetical protein
LLIAKVKLLIGEYLPPLTVEARRFE